MSTIRICKFPPQTSCHYDCVSQIGQMRAFMVVRSAQFSGLELNVYYAKMPASFTGNLNTVSCTSLIRDQL